MPARLISGLSALILFGAAAPTVAATPVERGDVLQISVLEDPTLTRQAKVDADGRIVLPRLGGIAVAGQDLDQIRSMIEAELKTRDIIRTPTVLVEVASYRPIFVGGAVTNPGAVAFEPGLTVRHALILAGGLERTEESAFLSPVALNAAKTQLRAGSYQLVQVNSLIQRLESELERKTVDRVLDRRFVPARDADQIEGLDKSLLDDRIAEWDANRTHMQQAIDLVDVEIDVLNQQTELQRQESASQQDLLANTRVLAERNLVPAPRLQEVAREASRISRDLLESQAFLARARQTRSDREYELLSADTDWRIEIQRDLRDAMAERTRLSAEVEILRDRMLAAGLLLSDDGTIVPAVPLVTLHRTVGGKSQAEEASMDTEIRSGDLLEVTLVQGANG